MRGSWEPVIAGGIAGYLVERRKRGATFPQSLLSIGCGYAAELRIFHRFLPELRLVGVDAIEGFCKTPIFMGSPIAEVLWGQVGCESRHIWHRHKMAERSTIIPHPGKTQYTPLNVPHYTLDQVFHTMQIHGPVFLWLDAEGAELDIIRSGRRAMRYVSHVTVEVAKREPTWPREHHIMRVLRRNGLTHVLSFPGRKVYTQLWEQFDYGKQF